ncbi:MAG TPA: prepilin-type N-terminal cleavage/methylation domain-containing protein [Limnobacter sp.]|nr:prepilin-type N-terminal cleavage/methylation domain-containing protein [Limnobacter sp.]
MTNKSQSGFSLLELAIALAVLAILTGGVLKGRELLNSARVQSTITDLSALETAFAAFQSRYAALPGDFIAVQAAGLGNLAGNGNGLIEGDEECQVFQHLQAAGFIQGSFRAETENTLDCTRSQLMPNQFGDEYRISHQYEGPSSLENTLAIRIGQSVPVAQLAELDRKLDDGNPLRGVLQVDSAETALCTVNNAWDEADGQPCAAYYFLR